MKTALAMRVGKLVVPTHIEVTGVFYPADEYFYGGYDSLEGRGSISPVGAMGIPNAAPSPGATGEIISVLSELYEGVAPRLYISLRGDYAGAPPFASVRVDSHPALTEWFNYSRPGTRTIWYAVTPSMLVLSGRSRLVFA